MLRACRMIDTKISPIKTKALQVVIRLIRNVFSISRVFGRAICRVTINPGFEQLIKPFKELRSRY
jgi:hypothetical protein